MARYPTYEEYASRNAHKEGISRCNTFLSKNPKDIQLLITKLQLLCDSHQDYASTLEQLTSHTPPMQDIQSLVTIEEAVMLAQKNAHPPPLTAGPEVIALWTAAFKSAVSTGFKLDLLNVRFARAVLDNRLQDVQQTLIVWKAFQPKNRSIYMAHAAYTQLLSTSKEDLQARLALMLAKKAVKENFDEEKELDCRVVGQILARQGAKNDLEGIRERAFRESREVYEALGLSEKVVVETFKTTNGTESTKLSPRDELEAEVARLKEALAGLVKNSAAEDDFANLGETATRIFHDGISDPALSRSRGPADAAFVAISSLVYLFTAGSSPVPLLQAAFIAENLLSRNPHIHEARLILVYLYMRLHLGTLAAQFYDSLSIKEIQNDTVSHVLYTRLSLTNPFRSTSITSRDVFDPHERSAKALAIFPRHESRLADTEAGVVEHGQSGMIFDLQALRATLRRSLPRRMLLLEHRRIARMTNKAGSKSAVDALGPRVLANWTGCEDSRDFHAAFEYGFNVEKALCGDKSGMVGERWMLLVLAADTAACLANGQVPLIEDGHKLAEALNQSQSEGSAKGSVSDIEEKCGDISQRTLQLLLSISGTAKLAEDNAESTTTRRDALTSLTTCVEHISIDAILSSTSEPDSPAESLQSHYALLDVLRTILATCRRLLTPPRPSEDLKADVTKLKSVAEDLVRQVMASARKRKDAISPRSLRETIEEGLGGLQSTGKEVWQAFAAGNATGKGLSMEDFVKAVVESAREGWEGVEKVGRLP